MKRHYLLFALLMAATGAMACTNFIVGKNNVVQGYGNSVIGNNNRVVGYSNTAQGNYTRSIGFSNRNTADYTDTFGLNCRATAYGATAVGNGSVASGQNSMAMSIWINNLDSLLDYMNLGDSDWWYWFMD